jgi:hypothetical protein
MGWRKWRIRSGDDIRWSYGRTRSLASSVLVRCLNLNSANGILQHRTLTVEVCFVKRANSPHQSDGKSIAHDFEAQARTCFALIDRTLNRDEFAKSPVYTVVKLILRAVEGAQVVSQFSR